MRACSRSSSLTSASPISTRVMPGFFSAKREQHHDGLLGLRDAVGALAGDLVDEREQRGLDELDQPLEHLRLAREVAVERRLGHVELRGERGGRDLLAPRVLEHRRERLQDLQPALAGLRAPSGVSPRADRPRASTARGVPSARIIVPTPSLVSTSSSSACSTRPSMMCELATPFFTASSAEPIFGSMPPWIVPSANSASISLAVSPVSSLPCLSSTPVVLVISTSFSALQRLGELAGDEVGVDVVRLAVAADADRRDHRDEVARVEQLDDLGVDALDLADEADVDVLAARPTRSSILRAWMNAPSWPVSPTALPPCWLMRPTISWLSSPSTISTTFIDLLVGHAHALPEFALDAHLLQQVADLRAAAVHDHRVHPDELQHHDVAREAGLERAARSSRCRRTSRRSSCRGSAGCRAAPRRGSAP